MAEYIEKAKLIDYVKDAYGGGNEDNTCIWYKDVIDMIHSELAADVQEVRHGHWIKHTLPEIIKGEALTIYECSRCKIMQVESYNYCPNCGSKNCLKKKIARINRALH